MLSIAWSHISDENLSLLKDILTPARVKIALKNLKSLAINRWGNYSKFIGGMILDNLACQLKSLHLETESADNWKFVVNNYPCTKNVEHSCLSRGGLCDMIDCYRFPDLKHLRFSWFGESAFCESTLTVNLK